MEEVEGLFGSETFCVFREGLCGDANGFDFVVAGFEDGAGALQHGHGVGDLLLILGAIEVDESGDGADFGARGIGRGFALGGGGGCGEEERDQDYEDAWAVWGHFFG